MNYANMASTNAHEKASPPPEEIPHELADYNFLRELTSE